jgi:CRP/FNR family transcriptional regulator, cyclic AMP receptor protein
VETSRLAAIPLLADLDAADLALIAASAHPLDVPEGDLLTAEGEFGHALFAIESGTADVAVEGETRASLGPGDVSGEIAVLASGRRTASVVATSPMRLILLFKRDVWELERRSPRAAERLPALVAERRESRKDPV